MQAGAGAVDIHARAPARAGLQDIVQIHKGDGFAGAIHDTREQHEERPIQPAHQPEEDEYAKGEQADGVAGGEAPEQCGCHGKLKSHAFFLDDIGAFLHMGVNRADILADDPERYQLHGAQEKQPDHERRDANIKL